MPATDCAVALVFVLAGKGCVHRRHFHGKSGPVVATVRSPASRRKRQPPPGRSTWLFETAATFFQDFHSAINAQHLRHFFREVECGAQIVAHFVRLHVFLVEDFGTPCPAPGWRDTHVLAQAHARGHGTRQPRRPPVRVEVLASATGQINQPCLGFNRDGGSAARPRAIIEAASAPSATACSTQRWTVW